MKQIHGLFPELLHAYNNDGPEKTIKLYLRYKTIFEKYNKLDVISEIKRKCDYVVRTSVINVICAILDNKVRG